MRLGVALAIPTLLGSLGADPAEVLPAGLTMKTAPLQYDFLRSPEPPPWYQKFTLIAKTYVGLSASGLNT